MMLGRADISAVKLPVMKPILYTLIAVGLEMALLFISHRLNQHHITLLSITSTINKQMARKPYAPNQQTNKRKYYHEAI